MHGTDYRTLVRNFIIELVLYGTLIFVYFLVVLQFLSGWVTVLFYENLSLYAVVALVLVVAQAVLLDAVTTFMIRLLKLESFE